MTNKESIELIAYAIKQYHDVDTNKKFSVLEYYSITDLSPKELATEAIKLRMCSNAKVILNFGDDNYWNLRELNMENRFKHFHSFNGVELTSDDKLAIYERISSKGYPLLDGIYDREAYFYANNFDFTKEEIRDKVIASRHGLTSNAKKDVKVMKK